MTAPPPTAPAPALNALRTPQKVTEKLAFPGDVDTSLGSSEAAKNANYSSFRPIR